MAKNLADFLREQAKKAGINIDDDAHKAFFTNDALTAIEVPETIFKAVDSSLISLTDAKNNHPDIKNFYTRQSLDTLDKTIDALMEKFGFSADDINEIKVERSSYARPELLAKKIQQLEQKKANADKPDRAAIQKQIDDLHAGLRTEQEKTKKLETDYALKEKQMRVGYKLQSLLGEHKTIYDELDPEVKYTTFQTLLNKRLQDNNAKLDFDENGNFILIKNDGTNFYGDSNQQVNAKQFVEQTLSANKLLVTTKTAPNAANGANGQQSQNGQQNGSAPANGSGKQAGANGTYKELMAQAQKDAAQATPVF